MTESNQLPVLFKTKDGRLMWIGRYSNSFEDNDFPPEIIESSAHRDFIERVSKGEVPLPDLLIAHRPEWNLGKAEFITYDEVEDGVIFPIAVGYITEGKEEVATALLSTECTMSHGMPVKSLRRGISRYDSSEVSVTPKGVVNPANRLTSWAVVDNGEGKSETTEEEIMIEQKMRAALEAIIGKQGIEALENDNKDITDAAKAQQIAYKSEPEDALDSKAEDVTDVAEDSVVAEETETVVADATEVEVAEPQVTATLIVDTATLIGEVIAAVLEPHKAEVAENQLAVLAALNAIKQDFEQRLTSLEGQVKSVSDDVVSVQQQAGQMSNKAIMLEAYRRAADVSHVKADSPEEPQEKEQTVPQYSSVPMINSWVAEQRGLISK